jgi:hypothetical protein
MDRAEYNSLVQDMQRFCISANLLHRVRPVYVKSVLNDAPTLHQSRFEVYYGKWRGVGREDRPMTPQVQFDYDEIEDARIRAEVASDLSH